MDEDVIVISSDSDDSDDIRILTLSPDITRSQRKRPNTAPSESSAPKWPRLPNSFSDLSKLSNIVDGEVHMTRNKRMQLQEIFTDRKKPRELKENWQRDRSVFDPEYSNDEDEIISLSDSDSLPDIDSDVETLNETTGSRLEEVIPSKKVQVKLYPIKQQYSQHLAKNGFCKVEGSRSASVDSQGKERHHLDLFQGLLSRSLSEGHVRPFENQIDSDDSDSVSVRKRQTLTKNVQFSVENCTPFAEKTQESDGCKYRFIPYLTAEQTPVLQSRIQGNLIDMKSPEGTPGNWVRKFTEPETVISKIDDVKKRVGSVELFNGQTVEPTKSLYKNLLDKLLDPSQSDHQKIHKFLKKLLSQHPPHDELHFTWGDVEAAIEKLGLENSRVQSDGPVLALDIIVTSLELELLHRKTTAQRQITKSVAFRWLSPDSNFSRIRQIAHWLILAVHSEELVEMDESILQIQLGMQASTACQSGHHKLLCILQRLLEIPIAISRQPKDASERIAIELASQLMHMPSYSSRRLLLITMSSPLLRFKVVQRVLEDHCHNASYNLGSGFGNSFLEDLFRAFFREPEPPMNNLTPPPTPDDNEGAGLQRNNYSMESGEELAMLLYIILRDYILVRIGALHQPTSVRKLEKVRFEKTGLPPLDKIALRSLPAKKAELRLHLMSMCGNVTSKTDMYLLLMECLAEFV